MVTALSDPPYHILELILQLVTRPLRIYSEEDTFQPVSDWSALASVNSRHQCCLRVDTLMPALLYSNLRSRSNTAFLVLQ